MAFSGHRSTQAPNCLQRLGMKYNWGLITQVSGLEHQRQRKKHPLIKTVVLIPGPSWVANLLISVMIPRFFKSN